MRDKEHSYSIFSFSFDFDCAAIVCLFGRRGIFLVLIGVLRWLRVLLPHNQPHGRKRRKSTSYVSLMYDKRNNTNNVCVLDR